MRCPALLSLLLLPLLTACSVASAPPELAVTALDFTPAPGMSRIYVYRPSRFFGTAALITIAVDSLIVGKVSSGTFLMLDVEPGRHRVSSPTVENESAVVVETVADSVYVLKVWPKMGFVAAQAGMEPMSVTEGAAAVREARMAVTTWPGTPMVDDGVRAEPVSGQGMP
jgi:hypothetical protein